MTYFDSSVFNNSYKLITNNGTKAPIVQAQGLPVELWHQVFESLSTTELCHMRAANRTFCQLVTDGVAAGAVKIVKSENQKVKDTIEALRPYFYTGHIFTNNGYSLENRFEYLEIADFDSNGELERHNEFIRDSNDNILKYKVTPGQPFASPPTQLFIYRYLFNGMIKQDNYILAPIGAAWKVNHAIPGVSYSTNTIRNFSFEKRMRLLDEQFRRGANKLAQRDGLYRYADSSQNKDKIRPDWEAVMSNPTKYPNALLWKMGKDKKPIKDKPVSARKVKVKGQIAPFQFQANHTVGEPPRALRQQTPTFQRAVPQNKKPQVMLAGANKMQPGPIPSVTKSKGCCAKLLELIKKIFCCFRKK